MAVTTVDAPFLDKPHQRSTVSQKARAEFPTPVPRLVLTHLSAQPSPRNRGLGAPGRTGIPAAQGHITCVIPTLLYLRPKKG